jgi:hypothetical protein
MTALNQYLNLWDVMNSVELNENIPNKHIWRLSSLGKYTAKSAYDTLFQEILGTPKCRFFMWLVAHNRCWTTDRLARRGLPHLE